MSTIDASQQEQAGGGVERVQGVRAVVEAFGDIKLAHSVFALPFAVLGAVLAFVWTGAAWVGLEVGAALVLVVVCMVSARTWAMLINRLADRVIDAANPRTSRRAVASGRLGVRSAWGVAAGSALVFVGSCAGLWFLRGNAWPLALSPLVLVWIGFYSYSKRFTWLCHVLLGSALAISPLCAAVAVEPMLFGLSSTGLGLVGGVGDAGVGLLLLAGFVLLWVAGFDVAYALQDLDFDRGEGLHSVPAAFGVSGAMWIARLLHVAGFGCLVGFAVVSPGVGAVTLGCSVIVGGVLVFEHVVLSKRGVAGLPLAFFTLNGVISVLLGSVGVVEAVVIWSR